MSKLFNSFSIFHLLFLSLIIRIFAYYFYGDNELVNEWEVIIHNYEITNIFGIHVAVDEYVAETKLAEVGDRVLPSAFMPPLYYYFIYLIKYFASDLINIADLIIFTQITVSLISILIFFKILKLLIKKELIIFLTFIFAFFPINILAVSQISSVTLQIFFMVNFFYFLFKFENQKKIIYLVLFSIFSGLLILIRGEFFLFYFLTIIYYFFYLKVNFKAILVSIIITLLMISPYLYKNYTLFKTITLTKSFGYNLLKGNTPNFKVEGDAIYIEKKHSRENLKIKTDNKYEINLDNYYKSQAIEYIKNSPTQHAKFYFIKLLSFTFFDINSSYANYYNVLHIFPKIILSISSLFGAIISLRKKGLFQYLSFFYFINLLLFSVFFILPRYSLILLPAQLILSIKLVKTLKRKLFN